MAKGNIPDNNINGSENTDSINKEKNENLVGDIDKSLGDVSREEFGDFEDTNANADLKEDVIKTLYADDSEAVHEDNLKESLIVTHDESDKIDDSIIVSDLKTEEDLNQSNVVTTEVSDALVFVDDEKVQKPSYLESEKDIKMGDIPQNNQASSGENDTELQAATQDQGEKSVTTALPDYGNKTNALIPNDNNAETIQSIEESAASSNDVIDNAQSGSFGGSQGELQEATGSISSKVIEDEGNPGNEAGSGANNGQGNGSGGNESGSDGNNGHGNDDDGIDESNPSNEAGSGANNGQGNGSKNHDSDDDDQLDMNMDAMDGGDWTSDIDGDNIEANSSSDSWMDVVDNQGENKGAGKARGKSDEDNLDGDNFSGDDMDDGHAGGDFQGDTVV